MSTLKQLAELIAQNARLTELVEGLVKSAKESERASFTIQEFCARNKLSERQFYKLKSQGRAPRMMSTGDVGLRISKQAELDWIKDREAEGVAKVTAA
jgi:hypothetical protein